MLALEIESLFDALLSWFPVAAVLSMSSFCLWFSNVVLGGISLVTIRCVSSSTFMSQFMKIQRYQIPRIFLKANNRYLRIQKFLGPKALKTAMGRGPEYHM